ncbi:putative IS200/IS605-family transposase [Octadecabacter antarcticus 307]|uniref:Putative IS200/IS605-family transposase n=2 Tax=Octadecabacter TaxID=53945 RepID=M9RGI0_9RHOB|nr:putative IS200/IS605-family transposase [Octadecabacter antarcticus 307]
MHWDRLCGGKEIMAYSTGSHTRFYHRYHVVLATKYRHKVLRGPMREQIRDIIRQSCAEMGVHILRGVLAGDHVHMFISVPPQIALSKVMQRIKWRSSRRGQMEFPELRKRYWGRRFWARGYFSTTSGNVTDNVILQYLELHSNHDATGLGR